MYVVEILDVRCGDMPVPARLHVQLEFNHLLRTFEGGRFRASIPLRANK